MKNKKTQSEKPQSKEELTYLHCLHQRVAARLIRVSQCEKKKRELVDLAAR